METTAIDRKLRLEAKVAEFQKRKLALEQEVISFDQKAKNCLTDLAQLQVRHDGHCRDEALGRGRGEHAQVEVEMSRIRAKQRGLETLATEKRAEIQQLLKAAEPAQAELARIHRQENIERESAAIERLYEEGLSELATREQIVQGFAKRLATLRGYEDPALKPRAFECAEKLQRAWHGM